MGRNPRLQIADGQENTSGLVFAGGVHLLETSLERGFLLNCGQLRQQQGMADADMLLIERGGGVIAQVRQLEASGDIRGCLAHLGGDLLDGEGRLLQLQKPLIALGLFHRVHVPALEVFDKLRLQLHGSLKFAANLLPNVWGGVPLSC